MTRETNSKIRCCAREHCRALGSVVARGLLSGSQAAAGRSQGGGSRTARDFIVLLRNSASLKQFL